MKIGLVIMPLLEVQGGLERVGVALANEMCARGHEIIIFHEKNSDLDARPVYAVNPRIPLVGLNLSHKTWFLHNEQAKIVNTKPDVLVVFDASSWLIWFPLLLKGTGIPLLISEHCPFDNLKENWNFYEWQAAMSAADRIHMLKDDHKSWLPQEQRGRISVIPNAVFVEDDGSPCNTSAEGKNIILAAGRFYDEIKQFSLLIRAFALLAGQHEDWNLLICGDGESRRDYEKLISDLGLDGRVHLPGEQGNMSTIYRLADIFCLPSKAEAAPLVAFEAQAYGLPLVGFGDCEALSDIIRHEVNGLLVAKRSSEELAAGLTTLMRDAGLRQSMGERARACSAECASKETVFEKFEQLLHKTAENKNHTRIDRVASSAARKNEQPLAELLSREHPHDRRAYLRLHKSIVSRGGQSFFTDSEIRQFDKKNRRFGLTGPRRTIRIISSYFK